jgi:hypothetical protein
MACHTAGNPLHLVLSVPAIGPSITQMRDFCLKHLQDALAATLN